MAGRPNKATVDYFPHYCTHGKTLFIIEQQFGNNGYAFWFKLLEYLGKSDGHVLDYKDADVSEYLQALTRTDDNLCMQILNKLAKLGAIDNTLWTVDKLVWSDNFLENIKDAYKRRKDKLPQKPVSSCIDVSNNAINADINTPKQAGKRISARNNPERERESKEKGKAKYSEYVSLTSDEYGKLVAEHGDAGAKRLIDILDNYKGSSGKKYVSDYRAILNWVVGRYHEELARQGKAPNNSKLSPAMDGLMDIINGRGSGNDEN